MKGGWGLVVECELTTIIMAYKKLVSFKVLAMDSPSDGDDEISLL